MCLLFVITPRQKPAQIFPFKEKDDFVSISSVYIKCIEVISKDMTALELMKPPKQNCGLPRAQSDLVL